MNPHLKDNWKIKQTERRTDRQITDRQTVSGELRSALTFMNMRKQYTVHQFISQLLYSLLYNTLQGLALCNVLVPYTHIQNMRLKYKGVILVFADWLYIVLYAAQKVLSGRMVLFYYVVG